MIIKVKKVSGNQTTNLCRVPARIMRKLNLSEGTPYTLSVGLRSSRVFLKAIQEYENMYFPTSVFENLLLLKDARLTIWSKNSRIHLGPVVGVFVNERYIKDLSYGKPALSVRKLIQANKKGNCLVYYFSYKKVNWDKNVAKGYVFHPRYRKWKYCSLPIPDVIYDRAVGFSENQKPDVQNLIQKIRNHPSVQLINNKRAFGKWRTHEALSSNSQAAKFLPETIVYSSFSDLQNMIEKHQFVFLKSFHGSLGREVMAIEKNNNQYTLTFYKKGLKKVVASNLQGVKKYVIPFVNDKKFVIQRGVRVFKYRNHPIDMRVHLNKNRYGKWVAISNLVRVSTKNAPITNEAVGAKMISYRTLYRNTNGVLPTDQSVRKIAIRIAKAMEEEFGELGEIGLDLAIDRNGRTWMIEANSKPDKDPVPGVEDTKGIAPQFLAILDYSKYLASR